MSSCGRFTGTLYGGAPVPRVGLCPLVLCPLRESRRRGLAKEKKITLSRSRREDKTRQMQKKEINYADKFRQKIREKRSTVAEGKRLRSEGR